MLGNCKVNFRLSVPKLEGVSPLPLAPSADDDVVGVGNTALDAALETILDTALDRTLELGVELGKKRTDEVELEEEKLDVLEANEESIDKLDEDELEGCGIGVIGMNVVESIVFAGSVASGVPPRLVKVTAGSTVWKTDGDKGITCIPVVPATSTDVTSRLEVPMMIDDEDDFNKVASVVAEVDTAIVVSSVDVCRVVMEVDEEFTNLGSFKFL